MQQRHVIGSNRILSAQGAAQRFNQVDGLGACPMFNLAVAGEAVGVQYRAQAAQPPDPPGGSNPRNANP